MGRSPVLSAQLQMAILAQACQDLDQRHGDYQERVHTMRRNLYAFCLVSRAWAAEAQRLLFRSPTFLIDLDAEDYEAGDEQGSQTFFDTLRTHPTMSQHVETIGLFTGHAHCKRLLKFLESSTLPNLKNLDGFPWDALAVHTPPPHLVRPRLDSLTVLQLDNVPDFSPAFPWFDLSVLRMLEITANLDDKNTRRAIQEASPALEELGLHLFEMEDYIALVACLGRFKSLKTLKLYVQNWTSPLDAALLNSLPALQHLTMYHGGLSSAWVVPHASLQTLSLESPPPTFELDPADGDGDGSSDDTLYRNITALCQTIKEDPSAYPALRNVSVPSSYEKVSFATEESRGAVVLRLGKVLGELQAAGLRLVDDEGLEWREEWVGNQDDCGLPKYSAPASNEH